MKEKREKRNDKWKRIIKEYKNIYTIYIRWIYKKERKSGVRARERERMKTKKENQ